MLQHYIAILCIKYGFLIIFNQKMNSFGFIFNLDEVLFSPSHHIMEIYGQGHSKSFI